jgi:hypothetical protein
MALLAYDGFDNYATSPATDVLNRRGGGWQWNIAANNALVSPGRGGFGSAESLGSFAVLSGALTVPIVSGGFGFGLLVTAASIPSYANFPTIQILDTHTGLPQLTIVINLSSGGFDIYRGTSATANYLGSTQNNAFTLNQWNYVEIGVTIDPSAGSVTVNNNGQPAGTLSGVHTQATTNKQFDGLAFLGSSTNGVQVMVDDFYAFDTTLGPGPFPFNSFAGDVRVARLGPIANGSSTQWAPLANTNWQEVSEVHSDGDTSYNVTSTVGNKDLFTFAALTSTISTVLAVQITGSYRKDDGGTHTLQQHLLSGSAEVAGATLFVPLNYIYFNDFWTVDPNTSTAWTSTAVNALQAGYELVS